MRYGLFATPSDVEVSNQFQGMALDDLVVLSQGLSSAFFAHHKTRPSEESNKLTILYWEVATSTIRYVVPYKTTASSF